VTTPPSHAAAVTGTAFALVASTGFATWTVLTEVAFRHGVGVPLVIVSRFVIGAVSLWSLVGLLQLSPRLPRRQTIALMAVGVAFLIFAALISMSIERISAATASLVLYTHPAMVATLGLALGQERWNAVVGVGLVLSLAGTTLILGVPRDPVDAVGVVLGLAAALFLAINILSLDRIAVGLHPFVASAYVMTGATLASAGYLALPPELGLDISGFAWFLVVVLGLVATVVAFTAKVMSITRLGPTRAAIGSAFEPVGTVLLAAVVLSTRLGPWQIVGGLLIVVAAGILPVSHRATRGAPRPVSSGGPTDRAGTDVGLTRPAIPSPRDGGGT
jgi:drug/metabolite transporter (DMT)-like permease